MKHIALVVMGSLAVALVVPVAAVAAPAWSAISFTATPQSSPQVLAAADKLMASEVGKEFPGRLLLQVHLADGANPATHSFVPVYRNAAQREAFVQKLQATSAWNDFLAVMTKESQPVSTVMYRTLQHWGEIVDTDHVWMAHSFHVEDPADFVEALNEFLASPTGKKFPGQAYLSSVSAGGITPVTHVISVGYASEAERDTWLDLRNASADWQSYLDATSDTGDYLGTSMSRDLKWWGPATLQQIVAP